MKIIDLKFPILVQHVFAKKTLTDVGEISHIQKLCSEITFEQEMHWANKIIKSNAPMEVLGKYPKFNAYLKFIENEFLIIENVIKKEDLKLIFVGGGPLPLTAILFYLKHGIRSHIIDINPSATKTAKKLLKKLGIDKFIQVETSSGENFNGYHNFNTIHLASHAGLKNEKKQILSKIKKNSKKDTILLTRSGYGRGSWLYQSLNETWLKGFEKIAETKPEEEDMFFSHVALRLERGK